MYWPKMLISIRATFFRVHPDPIYGLIGLDHRARPILLALVMLDLCYRKQIFSIKNLTNSFCFILSRNTTIF